jgi:hypothetical protein
LINIHARDVEIGRTGAYLLEPCMVATNLFTVPFWGAGLYVYCFKPVGARYRMLGWMSVIPCVLFLVTQGRSYDLAPAYPLLMAAGVVVWEPWVAVLSATQARVARRLT